MNTFQVGDMVIIPSGLNSRTNCEVIYVDGPVLTVGTTQEDGSFINRGNWHYTKVSKTKQSTMKTEKLTLTKWRKMCNEIGVKCQKKSYSHGDHWTYLVPSIYMAGNVIDEAKLKITQDLRVLATANKDALYALKEETHLIGLTTFCE